MSMLRDILEGHYNEALSKNNDLGLERIDICFDCPLFTRDNLGMRCNNKLYLNTKTGETSSEPKEGFRKGCGCRLEAKTRLIRAKCPLGKW